MENNMKDRAKFTSQDIEIVDKEIAYKGYFEIQKIKFRHRLFDGGWSETITRELVNRGDSVGLLLYDPKMDTVVLIEQLRVGVLFKESNPWMLEIVAGMIEKNESSTQVAIREAKEEAGCEVSELIKICHYYLTPGGNSESMQLFCACIDSSKVQEGVRGLASENEDIYVYIMPRIQAYQLFQSGEITNGPTIIALQWLQLNYEKIACGSSE